MPKENPQDTELPGVPGLRGEEPSIPVHPGKERAGGTQLSQYLMVYTTLPSEAFDKFLLSK